ncbi:hypothetical protein V8F06_014212 [Rhypophila decipiens]
MSLRHRRPILALILAGTAVIQVRANQNWTRCGETVRDIIDGKASMFVDGVNITNLTISQYLYTGPVTRLDASYPRGDFLTVTYEGCNKLCSTDIAFYEPATAISLVSNWIFPLNILLSLPFESLHEGKFHTTLIAILNWLGSPQTALTATIFNFRQLRQSHRRVMRDAAHHNSHLLYAAFFVLCSINQFHVDPLVLQGVPGGEATRMLKALVYGIFRPLSDERTADGTAPAQDVELTRQLLVQVAFQLRMLRRRGVIPMLANLGTFLVAFIFSVVLAFASLGDGSNSNFSLAFGLLVTWLPLLVVFTIVDRNPISSERTAEIISRWLYNVEAVKAWAAATRNERPPPVITLLPLLDASTPAVVDTLSTMSPGSLAPKPEAAVSTVEIPQAGVKWWQLKTKIPSDLQVKHFIGQGRKIQYCGLPHAFLEVTKSVELSDATPAELDGHAMAIAEELRGGKPLAWFVVAVLSFLLVWTAIMSAFVVSFNAPVVGLGCRTLTYLIFGIFSSVPWVIHFQKRPPRPLIYLSYLCNTVAILAVLTVVLFQVTGLASNCFCKSSVISRPAGLGGYVDFETYSFYTTYFNVIPFWTAGAVVGGMVPTIAFIVALFWWVKCRQIWKANERTRNYPVYAVKACTDWLQ